MQHPILGCLLFKYITLAQELLIKQKGGVMKKHPLAPQGPKILIIDIETMANLIWAWQLFDTNYIEIEQDWFMLSWVAKWHGTNKVISRGLCDYPGYKRDKTNDKALITELWNLINEADVVLGHNGDAFDIKKANARFLFHGLKPPAPYKTIDTKKIAKKHFGFASNKLDELCRQLGIGRKKEHEGWPLWKGCYTGDPKAWKKMLAYNVQDVELLDELYVKFLPWITNHPNWNLYQHSEFSCPNCGSARTQKRGFNRTRTTLNQRYQCLDCGAWSSQPISGKGIVR